MLADDFLDDKAEAPAPESAESFLDAESFLGPDPEPRKTFVRNPRLPQWDEPKSALDVPREPGKDVPQTSFQKAITTGDKGVLNEMSKSPTTLGYEDDVRQRQTKFTAKKREDERLAKITSDSTGGDLLLDYKAMAPATVKMLAGVGNIATNDGFSGVTRWADAAIKFYEDQKSEQGQAKIAELQAIQNDPNASSLTVLGFMLANPEITTGQAIQSMGSVVASGGLGAGVSKAGGALLAARGVTGQSAKVAAELASIRQKLATSGAILGEGLTGAGGVWDDLKDLSPADRYNAAATTFGGYLGIGKLTRGGAAGVVARGGGGTKTLGREIAEGAGEEYGQTFTEAAGKAVGTGITPDLNTVAKEATVAAGAGGLTSGVANVPAIAGELMQGSRERQFADAFNQDASRIGTDQVALDKLVRDRMTPGSEQEEGYVSPAQTMKPLVVPSIEAMPTEVMTPQEIAAAAGVAPPVVPETPAVEAVVPPAPINAPPSAVGDVTRGVVAEPSQQNGGAPITTAPQGSLAAAGESLLRENAAAAAPAAPTQEDQRFKNLQATYEADRNRLLSSAQALASSPTSAENARQAAERIPILGTPKSGAATQQFNQLAGLMESLFGRRPIAYEDARKRSVSGFFDRRNGLTFVNIANPEVSVPRTIFHEFKHQMQQLAKQGNLQAKEAEALLDGVWDLITPEGKRTYAEKYLFAEEIRSKRMTLDQVMADPEILAKLKEEMLADFMGTRATDRKFMEKLAKRDPTRFKAFAEQWIKMLDTLIKKLRGLIEDGGMLDIDKHIPIEKLELAKQIAEDALVKWADIGANVVKPAGPQAAPKVEKSDDIQESRRQPLPKLEFDEDAINEKIDRLGLGGFSSKRNPEVDVDKANEPLRWEELSKRAEAAVQYVADASGISPRRLMARWQYTNEKDYIELQDDLIAQRKKEKKDLDSGGFPNIPVSQEEIDAWVKDDADFAALQDELNAELQNIGSTVMGLLSGRPSSPSTAFPEITGLPDAPAPVVADFDAVTDKDIKDAGLMAESAYPQLDYVEEGQGLRTSFKLDGKQVGLFSYAPEGKKTKSVNASTPSSIVTKKLKRPQGTGGELLGGLPLTPDAAARWTQRVIASADLFAKKFDLLSSVSKKQAAAVVQTWNSIAAIPKAFEFAPSVGAKGASREEILQDIADKMLAGSKYSAKAWETQDGELRLRLFKGATDLGSAGIEYRWRSIKDGGPVAVMHTAGFDQGSGAGKPFYQVALDFADKMDATVKPDGYLLDVNGYRRSEQMVSAALRAGRSKTTVPGYAQRVYGWNEKPKTQKQDEENLARLMLATARNAAEFVPAIKDIRYDLKANRFTYKDGRPADNTIDIALLDPNVRAVSLSRSTLARAAITFQALEEPVDLTDVDEIASPILYSASQQVSDDKYAVDDNPFKSGYKRLSGRKLSYQVRVADTGEIATLTADAQQTLSDLDERADVMRKLIACLER